MKILLCYPPISSEYDKIRDSGVAPHLSLLCLASHIATTNPEVQILLSDGHYLDCSQISHIIDTEKPDIVGFSVDYTNYNSAVVLTEYVKSILPKTITICGSNHASNLFRQILTNVPDMDFVSINDGEKCIEGLIRFANGTTDIHNVPNLAYRENGNIFHNPIHTFPLADMVSVKYELVDLDRYFSTQERVFGDRFRMLQFTTQRGCANHPLCIFCGRFDDGMRFRDPSKAASEMAHYADKYELTEVWDRSDSFIQNVDWLKSFAHELNKRTSRFTSGRTTFKTYSRADQLLRQDVIDILKFLNFRMVFIGYEAGDDRILSNIGKHCNVDTYLQATKKVLENGISIDASFIVGLPGENRESLLHHIQFVERLVTLGLDKIRVNRLLVLPGTPIYNAIVSKFPEYTGCDRIPMKDLQMRALQTELYDLSDFDGDLNAFNAACEHTSHTMCKIVTTGGGAAEGYGHGKGANIAEGREKTISNSSAIRIASES